MNSAHKVMSLLVAWATLILTVHQAAPERFEQRPAFRARVSMVNVDVSVRVRNNPVPGLAARDFRLLDNGVLQQVEVVSIEELALDVSILCDASGSFWGWSRQLGETIPKIEALLRTNDRFRVVCFGNEVREVAPMHSPSELVRLAPVPDPTGTSLRDALFMVLMHEPEPDRRHIVITFTDGVDTTSVITGAQLLDAAEKTNASIHLVGIPSNYGDRTLPNRSPTTGRAVPAVISQIIEATGGQDHYPLSFSVPEALQRVLSDFRARYVLRYSPNDVAPAGWHTLEVQVPSVQRATIRARRGYFSAPGL